MDASIYDITAGMMNETLRQELIAANLAGANLAGFKGRHLLEPSFANELQAAEQGLEVSETTDFGQGQLQQTGRALDMALVGPGFFQVTTDTGEERLTRNGNFVVSSDGVLTTQEGYQVSGQGGRIQFGPEDVPHRVELREDGTLWVPGKGEQRREVGRLRLVQVDEPGRLDRISANYFLRPIDLPSSTAENARVVNGHLEGANITPVREMASMIESLRKFEMGQKMLEMNAELTRQEQQVLQA
jgi:flagellar basal-body rod protein FlgF